jgi:hypothetical protein
MNLIKVLTILLTVLIWASRRFWYKQELKKFKVPNMVKIYKTIQEFENFIFLVLVIFETLITIALW